MADESTPAEQSAAPAAKSRARARRVKRKVTKTVRQPRSSAPLLNPLLVASYVVLGLLVIGLSFTTGYLFGKSGGFGTGGTGNQFEGTLQIVEYSDFECPFCSRAVPTVEQIKQTYGDKVEVVYKHFPLESIHPNAFGAAVASECAREQGGDEAFWEYHDTLFANQQALDVASLKRYATAQGLNAAEFNKCLDNQETAAAVRADMQEAQSRGVQGTPSFWIQDELVVGAQPFNVFQQTIDAKLRGEAAAPPAPSVPSAPQAPAAPVDVAEGRYPQGSKDAEVVLVGFTDYECPFCKRFFDQTEQQIIDTYVKTGKVRYSVRHFPLSFHPNAQKASEAVECAAQQGKMWEMHEAVFDNQQAIDVASLKRYAQQVGVDTAKFNTCLDTGATAAIVNADTAAGSQAGVSGTPSFYVNGKQIVGAQPFSSFQAAIDAELS